MTPYEVIDPKDLYDMIDHFYYLVENDTRINHHFPGDFAETSRKQKQYLKQFLDGPAIYKEKHGHPMLRIHHMPYKITTKERDTMLENMEKALTTSHLERDIQEYLFERLKLTPNHMVNA